MRKRELRDERINLFLTKTEKDIINNDANIAGVKPNKLVVLRALNRTIYSADAKSLYEQMQTDYRRQVGFLKMLLRDCELTSEATRIAEATITDFTTKIETLEAEMRN